MKGELQKIAEGAVDVALQLRKDNSATLSRKLGSCFNTGCKQVFGEPTNLLDTISLIMQYYINYKSFLKGATRIDRNFFCSEFIAGILLLSELNQLFEHQPSLLLENDLARIGSNIHFRFIPSDMKVSDLFEFFDKLRLQDKAQMVPYPSNDQFRKLFPPPIEADDAKCADFMVKAFHAHHQHTKGKEINFYEDAVDSQRGITYLASTKGQWDGWEEIIPLTASTGVRWVNAGMNAVFGALGYEPLFPPVFIGMIGINRQLKKIIIAFRGTQFASEWPGNNANSLPYFFPPAEKGSVLEGISIHRGYWEISSQLIPMVKKELSARLNEQELGQFRIYFTGHSLGGTVAILTATALSDFFPQGIDIRPFASPPVGCEDFDQKIKELIEKQAIRIRHFVRDIDPIPNGFGVAKLLSYKSIGNRVEIISTSDEKQHSGLKEAHDFSYYHQAVYEALGQKAPKVVHFNH